MTLSGRITPGLLTVDTIRRAFCRYSLPFRTSSSWAREHMCGYNNEIVTRKGSARIYTNRKGEEIVFQPSSPPEGHVFVKAGNASITRFCRKHSPNVLAVYRPKGERKHATHVGLYVPSDIFKKALEVFAEKQSNLRAKLSAVIDERYPRMPANAKLTILQQLYPYNQTSESSIELKVYCYIRDVYTDFRSIKDYHKHPEQIAQVHKKVASIRATWRSDR